MTKYMDVSKAPMAVNANKLGWKPVIAMTPKTRSFLKRWRRRWAVKYRRLPLGPTLTEAESQKKALVTIKYFCCSVGNQMGKKKKKQEQKPKNKFIIFSERVQKLDQKWSQNWNQIWSRIGTFHKISVV